MRISALLTDAGLRPQSGREFTYASNSEIGGDPSGGSTPNPM